MSEFIKNHKHYENGKTPLHKCLTVWLNYSIISIVLGDKGINTLNFKRRFTKLN